jgi:myo-inositol-1-phosphate synthase
MSLGVFATIHNPHLLKGPVMGTIRIAVTGLGNCASSLIQGIEYYRRLAESGQEQPLGLMHHRIGQYTPGDIEVVAAFDIDVRKVGRSVTEAIFAAPNNTKDICRTFEKPGPVVMMGNIFDGISDHMAEYPEDRRFIAADEPHADIVSVLRDSGAEILVNYLPVGSQKATEYYTHCALEARVAFVNCIPVFIVSNPEWAARFRQLNVPCVGDDIKAQVGATIVHRTLARLFRDRGVKLDATYQLNTGGNTDFLNMLNQGRLQSKRISKTEAVQSQLEEPLPPDQIHIGPSDYVPWQKDNKVCFLRMEGRGFAGVPLNLELRLSVEDSPNSAGVAIDAIRLCKLAKDNGMGGPLLPVSAYLMKHPPVQMHDTLARQEIEKFLDDMLKNTADMKMALSGPAMAKA